MIFQLCKAPEFKTLYVETAKAITPYENLCHAITTAESSNDNFAINIPEQAYGAFQIRPIRLLDYNQRTGANYKMTDLFTYEISKKIFLYYCYSPYEIDKIILNWNCQSKEYLNRVKKLI